MKKTVYFTAPPLPRQKYYFFDAGYKVDWFFDWSLPYSQTTIYMRNSSDFYPDQIIYFQNPKLFQVVWVMRGAGKFCRIRLSTESVVI